MRLHEGAPCCPAGPRQPVQRVFADPDTDGIKVPKPPWTRVPREPSPGHLRPASLRGC